MALRARVRTGTVRNMSSLTLNRRWLLPTAILLACGTTVYLTDHEAFRVWRSNDSGTTWDEVTVGFDSAAAAVGPWEHGLPDGRMVAYKPVPTDSGGTRSEPYVITPAGSAFEPVDPASIRVTATMSVFSRKPTNGPRPPWRVSTPDGSWTPLRFGG